MGQGMLNISGFCERDYYLNGGQVDGVEYPCDHRNTERAGLDLSF